MLAVEVPIQAALEATCAWVFNRVPDLSQDAVARPYRPQAYATDKVRAVEEPVQAAADIIRAFPPAMSSPAAEQKAGGGEPASTATLDELARFVSAAVKWAQK